MCEHPGKEKCMNRIVGAARKKENGPTENESTIT